MKGLEVISIVNKKGGVAKTTTALALASGLALSGYRVLAIDCDSQANFTKASGGEDGVVGTFDILTGEEDINDAVQELSSSQDPMSYDLIGADKRLSGIDVALNRLGREYMLKKTLSQLKQGSQLRDSSQSGKTSLQSNSYDFCVIDNPPSLNVAVANSLVASDKVVICTCAEAFSVAGLMEISSTLDYVREFMNPGLKVDGILLTIFNPRTMIGQHQKEQLEKIAEVMKTKVYKTFIRRCNTISVSQSERKSVFEYSGSNVAEDYGRFVEEFLKG